MKGTQSVHVRNKRVDFKLKLRRNITVIQGNSGTGKTTLFSMIADYDRLGRESGVQIKSEKPCVALTDSDWKHQLQSTSDSIVFVDEGGGFVAQQEFAEMVNASDNYYVIFSRQPLHQLAYSINEIYQMKTSGKYHTLASVFPARKGQVYGAAATSRSNYTHLLAEDSKAGFSFYDLRLQGTGVQCCSAGSKSKIHRWLTDNPQARVFVVADGAAFGDEANRILSLQAQHRDRLTVCLPESFEWLILKSGLVHGDDLDKVLANPQDYVESADFLSWERFFTDYLVRESAGTPLWYRKDSLNEAFLVDANAERIMRTIANRNIG